MYSEEVKGIIDYLLEKRGIFMMYGIVHLVLCRTVSIKVWLQPTYFSKDKNAASRFERLKDSLTLLICVNVSDVLVKLKLVYRTLNLNVLKVKNKNNAPVSLYLFNVNRELFMTVCFRG
jgi:hypothetical protein